MSINSAVDVKRMRKELHSDRIFRLWEYQVSHDCMLIRGTRKTPADPGPSNIDLVFEGVEYLNIPSMFRGLELVEPTKSEIREAQKQSHSHEVNPQWVHILVTDGKRHTVVAPFMRVIENDWHNMDSHFFFRNHYHGLRPQEPVRKATLSTTIDETVAELEGMIIAESDDAVLLRLCNGLDVDGRHAVNALAMLDEVRPSSQNHMGCRIRFLTEADIPIPYQDEALRIAATFSNMRPDLFRQGTIVFKHE